MKKMSSFIPSNEFGKIYLAIWGYIYQPSNNPTDNYIYSNKKTIFNLGGEINRTTQKTIKLDELIVNDNVKIQLLFTKELNDITVTSNDVNCQPSSVTLYQYIGKGIPTEFIAEESTERDYYTKIETNNLLDKKQDKLITGENIKIDEKTNTISATGGSSVDENRIFNNKQDKIDTTRLITEIITINVDGQSLIYRKRPNMTNDLFIPDKKYVDDKVNTKQDKENWKIIGKRVDDRTWSNFSPSLHALYRVFLITETSVPLQNGYKEVIFFTPASAIGTGTYRITSRKIGNSDATLNMIYDNTKWTLKLSGGNTGGAIYRLEELKAEDLYEIKSNTLEIKIPEVIDAEKPIKIDSKTLLTKEIRENEWEINLKENPTPPTSCPCPKWKEVGTREKNKWDYWQITYDFQENKHYRVYYSWSIYNPVYTIQEFIITDKKIAGVQIQAFNDSINIVILLVQHVKWITIYTGKGNLKGNVWKLEELQ